MRKKWKDEKTGKKEGIVAGKIPFQESVNKGRDINCC